MPQTPRPRRAPPRGRQLHAGCRVINAEISGVFCKAAATLCASLPTYGCEAVKAAAVTVAGPNASFTATVDELAGEEEATSYVMACSCATNVAGGGAIANAEVEGVSLETLVQMACA